MALFRYDYVEQDDELDVKLLAEGEATFRVARVFDKDSKEKDAFGNPKPLMTSTGVPKLNVHLAVTDSRGVTGLVYENLNANAGWRIKALCKAIGRADLDNPIGELNIEAIKGAKGKCTVKTDNYNGVDKTIIDKYTPAPKQEAQVVDNSVKEFFDEGGDPIPF